MLCSAEGVHGAEDVMGSHVKNPLESYCSRRSDEITEALSSSPHGPCLRTIDQMFEKIGPRERRKTSALYTGAPQSLDEAWSWLSYCLENHEKCRQANSTVLPTRLIDITPFQQDSIVRLVETESLPLHCDKRYVALSYCWGASGACKLLGSNIGTFKKGLDISRLPLTIQNAIVVAQRLDLSYIWVDALCIIQDSRSDWEKEAVCMCDVYQGSYVSIAAKGGSSSEAGLFSLRDPLRHASCFLSTTDN